MTSRSTAYRHRDEPMLPILGAGFPDLEEAACKGEDTETFFPSLGQATAPPKMLCGTCPVKIECLTLALERSEFWGVWGGASERQRRRLRKLVGPSTAREVAKEYHGPDGAYQTWRRRYEAGGQYAEAG